MFEAMYRNIIGKRIFLEAWDGTECAYFSTLHWKNFCYACSPQGSTEYLCISGPHPRFSHNRPICSQCPYLTPPNAHPLPWKPQTFNITRSPQHYYLLNTHHRVASCPVSLLQFAKFLGTYINRALSMLSVVTDLIFWFTPSDRRS